MPILDLQQRQRELGRIRIGQKGPKGAPTKLDRFRMTSPSRPMVDAVAAAYGGEVREWTPSGGTAQWEVVTDSSRVPVLVPPQPLSQWYELWSGGGCQRRCDGTREILTDQPCVCLANGQEAAARDCKPTTRLNVVLRDLPGIGVWRLESHGWYAAVELPQLAAFLAQAAGEGTYLPAYLGLEERTVRRPGSGVRRFMVPTLDIDVTPAALMAGGGGVGPAAVEAAQPERPALESASDAAAREVAQRIARMIPDATTEAELDELGEQAEHNGMWVERIGELIRDRRAQISVPVEDPDDVWAEIVKKAPEDWSTSQLSAAVEALIGVPPSQATGQQLRSYLDRQAIPA